MEKEIALAIKSSLLHSAGEKRQIDVSSNESEIYFPSLNLSIEQLPELEGKDVDDTITLLIKGKIEGHSKDEYTDESKETFRISVKKIGLVK